MRYCYPLRTECRQRERKDRQMTERVFSRSYSIGQKERVRHVFGHPRLYKDQPSFPNMITKQVRHTRSLSSFSAKVRISAREIPFLLMTLMILPSIITEDLLKKQWIDSQSIKSTQKFFACGARIKRVPNPGGLGRACQKSPAGRKIGTCRHIIECAVILPIAHLLWSL